MNKHKQKIDKARKDNPLMDYFLNPNFDEVATKKEKDFVKNHFEIITIKQGYKNESQKYNFKQW